MTFNLTPALLDAQALGESGSNPNIGSHYGPNDPLGRTASGGYGFTDGTWRSLAAKYPDLGLTMANKNDFATQRRAYAVLAQDNANVLGNYGVTADPTSVSLASFLGPKAAAAFIKADPNASASDVLAAALGPAQASQFMASNPTILGAGAKVGDVIAKNNATHVNSAGPTPMSGMGQPTPPQQPGQGQFGPMAQPMPANFGQSQRGPSPVTQVPGPGPGDDALSIGLAMLGGAPNHTGFSDAAKAYQASMDRAQSLAITNANLKEAANKRDWDEPNAAARAAYERATAWNTMQAPTTLTAAQNANLQMEKMRGDREDANRAEDVATRRAQLAEQQRQFDNSAKPTSTMIVPGSEPGKEQTIQVTTGRDGSNTIRNLTTGEQLDKIPEGAVLPQTYNSRETQQAKLSASTQKAISGFLDSDATDRQKLAQIDETMRAVQAPGANAGSDVVSKALRTFAPLIGLGSDQQYADMNMSELSQSVTKQIAQGQGAISDYERSLFQRLAPSLDTDPKARDQFLKLMRDVAERSVKVHDMWINASPQEAAAARLSPEAFSAWRLQANKKIMQEQDAARSASRDAATAQQNAPAASQFWKKPPPAQAPQQPLTTPGLSTQVPSGFQPPSYD